MGPAVQDLWMLLAGDRETATKQLKALLDGYEQFHDFSREELGLIEPLRTLRLLHYSYWLARRWEDPAFPAAFPWFGTSATGRTASWNCANRPRRWTKRRCPYNSRPFPRPGDSAAHASLRRHRIHQRVPAVPGAADHRQADPALVRRQRLGLDRLHGVLPAGAARRLRLRRRRSAAGSRRARRRSCTSLLLAASLAFLPILASESLEAGARHRADARILLLLASTIGLPYFLLSTTGPLVQAWFARSFPGATVYRLFALSNLASLVALIAYPPLIEPAFSLQTQSYAWSAVYVVFAVLCACSAWIAARKPLR